MCVCVCSHIPLAAFKPNSEVQSLRLIANGLEVVVVPGKNDPQLFLATDPPVTLDATAAAMTQVAAVEASGLSDGQSAPAAAPDRVATAAVPVVQ